MLVKFNICNESDSAATVFFFPGFYYKEIELYKVVPGGIKKIPDLLPQLDDSIGYRGVTLQPKDSTTIIAALTFVKTYNNIIRPRLIDAGFLPSFISEYKSNHELYIL